MRVLRICWGRNPRPSAPTCSRPSVTIYRLIARDTVEERVLALHKEKRDLAADMLDGTGSSHLNSEILMGLIQGPAL